MDNYDGYTPIFKTDANGKLFLSGATKNNRHYSLLPRRILTAIQQDHPELDTTTWAARTRAVDYRIRNNLPRFRRK